MSVRIDHTPGQEAESPIHRTHPAEGGGLPSAPDRPPRGGRSRRLLLGGGVAIGGLLLIAAIATLIADISQPDQPLIYYTVHRGDLPITVTERGNLESQSNIQVICEVDDLQGDSYYGTTVLWIIPNGSSVKKGDLLLELDPSGHQERLDRQILGAEKALAEQIKAKAKLENQKTQNETADANAELNVELAKLELQMFVDELKGTHKLEVEEIKRKIEDINNEILAAQAILELKKNDKRGIEMLFKLGYAGKSELDRARLEFLQAESAYASTMNKLTTQLATLEKKEDYERKMELLRLQGALETAQRSLKQVRRDSEALLEQAEAASKAADESLKKENELLARYKEQVKKCRILAPEDGMVAYATSRSRWQSEIRKGAPAAPRQHVISLPNLKKMQVSVSVHESVLDEVKPGLPATIRVEAFPERNYRGSVQAAAVLPERRGRNSADTKVYATVVTIDEKVERLKPGMTAVVEIHVDRLRNVLSLPVQAVVQLRDETFCYVSDSGSPQRRAIKLGRTNGKFIEIRTGLTHGDRVVLNPMAIVDESGEAEEDFPGAEDQRQDVEPQDRAGPPRTRGAGRP